MKKAVALLAWPLLLAASIAIMAVGEKFGLRFLAFNSAYLFLGLSLFCLERYFPHRADWNQPDGEFWNDLIHSALSKGAAQILILSALTLLDIQNQTVPRWWPRSWPFALQVILGILIAEFALYWAHRLAHEVPYLWRFHAIHHSVVKLWFWNTGRFHFMDAAFKIFLSVSLLLVLHVPYMAILWYGYVTAFNGLLTHCNVQMYLGPLNWIVSTPIAHRWHHAPNGEEGNCNYGENFLLWDHIFGSFFLPSTQSPQQIGMKHRLPKDIWGQIVAPFQWQKIETETALLQKTK